MASMELKDSLDRCLSNAGDCSERFFSLLPVFGSEAVLKWCMEAGLIASEYECPKCGGSMKLSKRDGKKCVSDGFEWRCRKQGGSNPHDVSRSVRKGSWFETSHLDMCTILLMMRKWFGRVPQDYAMIDLKLSSRTAVDWYMFCREVCQEVVLRDSTKIGGPGVIVEIDESKFGKCKYDRGRRVDGNWVFGGVQRGSNNCFFQVVQNRSKDSLLGVIRDWVVPGTTIISDCWKSYDCLEDEGFVHLKVNHSLTFVDQETGAHTNTNEAIWSAIKRALRSNPHHRSGMFDSYLFEYIWRKSHGHSLDDAVFKQFIADSARI